MPGIKEIQSAGHLAWCPETENGTIIATTRRDTNTYEISLVDINLSEPGKSTNERLTSVSLRDSTTVGALNWSSMFVDTSSFAPLGVICGGFSNGTVKLWNANSLLSPLGNETSQLKVSDDLITCLSNRSQAVTAIETSANNYLACGYSDGSLDVINLNDPGHPDVFEACSDRSPGSSKRITGIAWNKGVQHILASTCSDGVTEVWNVKQRKQAITFRDPASRLCPSSVAWVPNQPTQVIVSYDDDKNPSLQMWDLRNSSYPFRDFSGHNRGILSLRVSEIDPSLMLSCGRDNRIVCWVLDELPSVFCEAVTAEAHTGLRWSPCLPGLYASNNVEKGTVVVDSVQMRQNSATKYIPKWYQKPTGVSFGFGGKLSSFCSAALGGVRIDVVPSTENDLVEQADEFEYTLVNNDYLGYCEKKIQQASDPYDRLTWLIVQTLFYPAEVRSELLLDRLGFKSQTILQEAERVFGKLQADTLASPFSDHSGLSHNNQSGSINQGSPVDAASFFQELCETSGNKSIAIHEAEEKSKVSQVSIEGSQQNIELEVRNWEAPPNNVIKTAFLIGKRAVAAELCVESGYWADALLLAATSGDANLWNKIKTQYIRERHRDKFFQLMASVTEERWEDIVYLADLPRWEETIALLASYVPVNRFPPLCEALGVRLESEMFDIRAAVVCYLAAGSFSHASQIWSTLAVTGSKGKSLQKGLQDLVEKLAVLKKATNYENSDALFTQKVSQYAEILANSGRLVAGMKLLCLVSSPSTADNDASTILMHRIFNSSPESMRNAGIPPPVGVPFQPVNVKPCNIGTRNRHTVEGLRQPQVTNSQKMSFRDGQTVKASHSFAQTPMSHQPPPLAVPTQGNMYSQPQVPQYQQMQQQPQPYYAPNSNSMNQANSGFGGWDPRAPNLPKYPEMPISPHPTGFQQPRLPPQAPPTPVATIGRPPASTGFMGGVQSYPTNGMQQPHGSSGPGIGAPLVNMPSNHSGTGPAFDPSRNAHSMGFYPSDAQAQGLPRSGYGPEQGYKPAQPQSGGQIPAEPQIGVPSYAYPLSNKPKSMSQNFDISRHNSISPMQPPEFTQRITPNPSLYPSDATSDLRNMSSSTAPVAAVSNIPPGMPIPWPIPTEIQQISSTTTATAPANHKVHADLDESHAACNPMNPSDIQFIERVLLHHLDLQAHAEPQNTRKHEDIRARVQDLVQSLSSGFCPPKTQGELLQLARALQNADYASAGATLATMLREGWNKDTRNWLTGLKRLLSK